MAKSTTVYPLQQNHNVNLAETPVEVTVDPKTQTVESTTQVNPVEILVPDTTIYTAGIQGPPGIDGTDGAPIDATYFEFTASSGQSVFTGADDNANTLEYVVNFISVSLNGVELASSDIIATDGVSITLVQPAVLNDFLEVFAIGQTPGSNNPSIIQYNAGEDIGGQRVVRISGGILYYADKDDLINIDTVVGLTTGAVTSGNTATVQTSGELEDPSWTWTAGPVYLGNNGVMTQTPPVTGILQQVGVALTATKMLIRVDDPLIRN